MLTLRDINAATGSKDASIYSDLYKEVYGCRPYNPKFESVEAYAEALATQKAEQLLQQRELERQQADAQRQSQIAGQAQGAQAARSGAFGGSGDYLMRGQAAGNLARQKGDLQATGLNNAYQQAMQQFNTSQGQNQAAQQLNAQQQQFGAGLGLQGLQTAMGTSMINTGK